MTRRGSKVDARSRAVGRLAALAVGFVLAAPFGSFGSARPGSDARSEGGRSTDVVHDASPSSMRLIIRSRKPYAGLVSVVEAAGGTVVYQYAYVDAIAVEIPRDRLGSVRSAVADDAISEDHLLSAPTPVDLEAFVHRATAGDRPPPGGLDPPTRDELTAARRADAIDPDAVPAFAAANPDAYALNDDTTNVRNLHAQGVTGRGVVVAVIDTGIRPDFPHLALDGSVVGGEDFVGDGRECLDDANNGHGTMVAGLISANALFRFAPSSAVRRALEAERPACFVDPPANTTIAMVGSAPLSSIYALRIFGTEGSAPVSRLVAAMERVIELRDAYEAGIPGGVDIEVCAICLGGPSLFAGRELQDALAEAMLEHGIVPVMSASNAGPSSLTIGSPGSSPAGLTVGAANQALNDRIARRLQYGQDVGSLYRPSDGTQTAAFSSRGPTADGRPDPEVVANGVSAFGQGFAATPLAVSFASGTSMSAATVAGLAALLRQAFPTATACQIRNALVRTADPTQLMDGSTELDRGRGYVDATAAASALERGLVADGFPARDECARSVATNVERRGRLFVRGGRVRKVAELEPGQRAEIVYRIWPGTRQVLVQLRSATPRLVPSEQNRLFGDGVIVAIHSAKTSAIGRGDYHVLALGTSGARYTIDDPEPGLLRVTLLGDPCNAGAVFGDVVVTSVDGRADPVAARGWVAAGQIVEFPVIVPVGVERAEFCLNVRSDWSRYPSCDVNLTLVGPDGRSISATTLDAPERLVVERPLSGPWVIRVTGAYLPTGEDAFTVRMCFDGA